MTTDDLTTGDRTTEPASAKSAARRTTTTYRGATLKGVQRQPAATSAAVSGLPRIVERSTRLRMTRARASSQSHLFISPQRIATELVPMEVCSLANGLGV
jgi:hypothetical protein